MAAVALRRSLARPRRNAPMNASRDRLPFALLVVAMIGAGFVLLAAQFVALGEVHAAHSARASGLASSVSSAYAAATSFTAPTDSSALTAAAAQRGSDNPVLA